MSATSTTTVFYVLMLIPQQIVLISRESFGDNMQLLVSAALTVMLSVSGWRENC